ncbi:MAG: DUF7211 domain-containing protein [Bacilli bacterium]
MGPDTSLTHFGVLGMKWGVRKDKKSSNAKQSNTPKKQKIDYNTMSIDDIKKISAANATIENNANKAANEKAAAKAKDTYSKLLTSDETFSKISSEIKEISAQASKEYLKAKAKTLDGSGSKSYDAFKDTFGKTDISKKRDAAINKAIAHLKSKGYSSADAGRIANQITHSDTLTHYGVLGMRWGVRKYNGMNREQDEARRAIKRMAKTYKKEVDKLSNDYNQVRDNAKVKINGASPISAKQYAKMTPAEKSKYEVWQIGDQYVLMTKEVAQRFRSGGVK